MTTINNAWAENHAWPSGRSLGEFARDAFRLSGAKTDREKALAFYDWFTRCMQRGANPQAPDGCGGYSRLYDTLPLWASWGHGECTFWGWIATDMLRLAGLRARRVVVHSQGHTYYEVWYAGLNGKESWHAFDPFGGWFFLNEEGEVASCEELSRNPQLVQNPFPGHPEPLGHHADRHSLAHRHRTEDQILIEQPLRDERLGWTLSRGQYVAINWLPEAPDRALFAQFQRSGEVSSVSTCSHGAHDDMPELDRRGGVLHPQHEPYWQNYRWPTPSITSMNNGQPVRWHGSGMMQWKPLLCGESAACYATKTRFENGILRPDEQHGFTEAWYHIRLPYLISFLHADYDFCGSGRDYCGLSISADDRRTIWSLPMKSNTPHYGTVMNGQAEWQRGESSVQGLTEFWLRVDMVSHAEDMRLALQALTITVGFQHNMDSQPRLVPGSNPLSLTAESLADDAALSASWQYQVDGATTVSELQLTAPGTVEREVILDVDCPNRIRMLSLVLQCR